MVWSRPGTPGGHLVVLLHGKWGVAEDMTRMFDRLPPEVTAVSLRGPRPLGERWAWVDADPASENAAGLDAAAAGVGAWLDAQVGWSSVGVVGYSQGGGVTLQLLRERPDRLAYAAVLAGFIGSAEDPRDAAVATVRPAVLYARGDLDDVIPPEWVSGLEEWLHRCATPTIRRYPGVGHDLTDEMFDDVGAFVAEQLRAAEQ